VCREVEESNDSLSSTLPGKSDYKKQYVFLSFKKYTFLFHYIERNFLMISISILFIERYVNSIISSILPKA